MTIAGRVIGDGVKLVRLLGRGSHSVVYFGVTREGQPCAVKIFPPHLALFAEREFRHALNLNHPRMAHVQAQITFDTAPALITTYARGVTLFERYTHKPALVEERQAFLLTLSHVLDALHFLHDRGLVHRDIKPDNIMVEPDGSAKLVDFDLSGPAYEGMAMPTRIGTAAFLSPEARRGDSLGPENDLYGVGVLLGWGIHGQLPEVGEALPPTRDPLTPLWRALTREDPRKRPHDATEVKKALLELALRTYLY
ncbi:serine/threonine protein kinase [Deinococcus cavernae]|uniref:Serine/threonine protein kinase n=1 Tax=Deinococcus cavernae TaxID=2320857 RepID=A0A418V547_9DEIO|nr:serine/threonine-protein kinase [Deinococcus cavernae]RJF71209.1 serine/threonine protein kinase [Deinococcus cavernae]